MLNLNSQFQNIKFQFQGIQGQFEMIEMQIKHMLTPNISSQNINLGINLINTGIQVIFMGIIIPDISRNYINIKNQINDLIIQMNNISMQMNNMNCKMGFLNYNNNLLNDIDEKWPKINVTFTTMRGEKNNLICNYGTPIDEVLNQYLIRTNSLQIRDKLDFRYECYTHLKIGDNRKIEDVCKNQIPNVKIFVYEFQSGI